MNACAEPYGVSRSAGASRRCRPSYSAACESRRQRQFIAGSAEAKAPTTPGATTPNSGVAHGVIAEANRAARPGAFEQRTEEHHLYHVNLSRNPVAQ